MAVSQWPERGSFISYLVLRHQDGAYISTTLRDPKLSSSTTREYRSLPKFALSNVFRLDQLKRKECTPLPSSPPRPPSSLSHLRAPSLRLPSALTSPRLGDSGRSPTSPSMIPRRATASASSSGGTTATPAPFSAPPLCTASRTTPGIAARPARDTATISPLLYRRTGRVSSSLL